MALAEENNLRIHFDDTSTSAGFAANDWRIIANASKADARRTNIGNANMREFMDLVASALTGIPYTVTTHAKDLFHEDVDPVLLRAVLGRAAHVIAISDYNRRFLLDLDPATAEAMAERLARVSALSRVTPEEKLRIVIRVRLQEEPPPEFLARLRAAIDQLGVALKDANASLRALGLRGNPRGQRAHLLPERGAQPAHIEPPVAAVEVEGNLDFVMRPGAAAERLVCAVERATAEGLPLLAARCRAGRGCRRARSPSSRW